MPKVVVYALSTCGWCRRTRKLLDENGVVYTCHEVDKLQGEERERILGIVKRWNPRASFPTVVIDDNKVIVGYKEDQLREELGL
jgi:glutaredoxin